MTAETVAALPQPKPPGSIAIAGAWGYIGRKLLEAARRLGLRVYVHDPGTVPADLDVRELTPVVNEAAFYQLGVDLFHLALHPEAREPGQTLLLERSKTEPICILNEKPIAAPENPGAGRQLLEAIASRPALMLYDFPELFDPLTHRIVEVLKGYRQIEVSAITVERSKDREDPAIPRNYKRMVPIQFQESGHCLAFVLGVLGALRGSFEEVLQEGVAVEARSEAYVPPNPEQYSHVVDGRCDYRLSLGRVTVDGVTNFKRGARWSKRRVLRGIADGEPLTIEADYLEGKKSLRINGVDQGWDPAASSYEAVLSTLTRWRMTVPAEDLMRGLYPNPRFAWWVFQLSGALWRSSHEERRVEIPDWEPLSSFDSGFPGVHLQLPRYTAPRSGAGDSDHDN